MLTDLLAGTVPLIFLNQDVLYQHVKSGKLRALAVSSARRVGVFKETPTMEDQGFRDMSYDDWYGFFVPAGTPAERVAYLHEAITTVLKTPTISQKIVDAGGEVVAGTPQQLALQLQQDVARWGRVAKASGAKLD